VELDSVRRDAGLTMDVVEEGDARDARASADTHCSASGRHLLTASRGRPRRTSGQRRLGDQLLRPVSQNDVEI
jgi:hypothetical protein